MKIIKHLVLIAFAVTSLRLVADGYGEEVWRALSYGAKFDVLFRIVDDRGSPVPQAECRGWKYLERARNHGESYSCLSDTNGFVRVNGTCGEWFNLVVKKDGYYSSKIEVKYPAKDANVQVKNGQWLPYGETRNVILKPVHAPHDMLGPIRTTQRKITIYNEWLGFDLERGDFLPPIGLGREHDMLIRFRRTGEMPYDWSITMDVSFTNHPYGGAYCLKQDTWSTLKSVYRADEFAEYRREFSYRYVRANHSRPVIEKLGADDYLVFRTRTKVNREGKLVSARYGKLYGPWHFEDAGGARITKVFLNALDNDLNLEDSRALDGPLW